MGKIKEKFNHEDNGGAKSEIKAYRERLEDPLAKAEALMEKYQDAEKWEGLSDEDLVDLLWLVADPN